ncbi:MAG: NAD(P)/FAD-dependent oxidoreductase [Flavobacterium sp.]
MLDYIIVGSGLAGIAFAETLLANDKSFVVFNDTSQNSTRIAGGLYNPIVLKRFNLVWNAKSQLEIAERFYKNIEEKLTVQVDFKMPIYRKFFSVEEQNNWFVAADKPNLTPYLSTKIIDKKYRSIDSPYGFGEVLNTGYINTQVLLAAYHEYLKSIDALIEETFDYGRLGVRDSHVAYKNIQARNVVFAEGFGLHANPYFNHLLLDGTKGELLIIRTDKLNLDVIVNTSVFIMPLGDNLYRIGATYNWEDKTNVPTKEGKMELLEKIKEILTCDFEVVDHLAGVRPTVNDRRPLIGTHEIHKNLHVLNGMGTRGVMLAPSMALELFDAIENGKPLDKSIDIKRYDALRQPPYHNG